MAGQRSGGRILLIVVVSLSVSAEISDWAGLGMSGPGQVRARQVAEWVDDSQSQSEWGAAQADTMWSVNTVNTSHLAPVLGSQHTTRYLSSYLTLSLLA